MVILILYSFLLVCVFQVFGMDTDPSYVSAKGLTYAYGYRYVTQLREQHKYTIDLSQTQFEAACRADTLPLDIQRRIKEYLGTGALQSLWAKSYAVRSRLQLPDYDASKKEIYLATSKQGLLAAAHDAIVIWNPEKSTKPCAFFCFSHPLEKPRWRNCIAFVSEDKIAEGVRDEIRIWDIEKQVIVSKLTLPMWDISHIVPHNKGLAFIAKIEEKPERFECDGEIFEHMVFTYRLPAITWNVHTNTHEEVAHGVCSLALADDKKTVALGTSLGMVELYDADQGKIIARYGGCGYTFEINPLVFLTPTLIASASSRKGSLVVYDSATNTSNSYGMSAQICNLQRINNTTLAVLAVEIPKETITTKIFNTTRGYVHSMPVSCCDLHAFATDSRNTIAVGCRGGEILLYRPQLPSVPDNNDEIPFVAYALAANEDTYEDNLIDDPDYCDDPNY
jgi:hypothetical protein